MNSLRPKRLRTLTVTGHPRGQPHLSAASGLVCAHGRVYVMADDEHHLAVFRDRRSPGRLHRVFAGNLPHEMEARKKRKPDVETLFLLPSAKVGGDDALIALGSGSRKNRQVGVAMALSARGKVAKESSSLRPETALQAPSRRPGRGDQYRRCNRHGRRAVAAQPRSQGRFCECRCPLPATRLPAPDEGSASQGHQADLGTALRPGGHQRDPTRVHRRSGIARRRLALHRRCRRHR